MSALEHAWHLAGPILLAWAVLSAVTVLLWSATFGRWLREEARAQEGYRCLQIADEYRGLALRNGQDGEAWTYEQSATWWERRARERYGVERLPRSSAPAEHPPSQAAGKPVPPWQA